MKSYEEIKRMIDKYITMLERTSDPEKRENYCHIIDALLWVIDDNSGAPI